MHENANNLTTKYFRIVQITFCLQGWKHFHRSVSSLNSIFLYFSRHKLHISKKKQSKQKIENQNKPASKQNIKIEGL